MTDGFSVGQSQASDELLETYCYSDVVRRGSQRRWPGESKGRASKISNILPDPPLRLTQNRAK